MRIAGILLAIGSYLCGQNSTPETSDEDPQVLIAGPTSIGGSTSINATGCGSPTAGMAAWYRADVGVTCTSGCSNGNTVTAWADQSGNANNLTTTSSTLTYVASDINSLPAINFPGVTSGPPGPSSFAFTTPIQMKTSTTFVVLKLSTNTHKQTLISGGTFSLGYWFDGNSGASEQGADNVFDVGLINGNAAPDTNYHQMNLTVVDQTSQALRLGSASDGTNTNTTQVFVTDSTVGYNAQALTSNACATPTACEAFVGHVEEIIIYTSAISTTTNEAYLRCRTGL